MVSFTNTRSRARFALTATAVICAAALGGAGSAQAGTGCGDADLQPQNAADAIVAEKATRCLVNVERRKRGLRAMKYNANLQKSSAWQASDMLEFEYFDHQRSGGPGFAGRITRFGYAKNANGYTVGENIAWATTDGASPREIVGMWMDSPGHRANILRKQFREQAISALYVDSEPGGDYEGAGPLVIYVNQFGARY